MQASRPAQNGDILVITVKMVSGTIETALVVAMKAAAPDRDRTKSIGASPRSIPVIGFFPTKALRITEQIIVKEARRKLISQTETP